MIWNFSRVLEPPCITNLNTLLISSPPPDLVWPVAYTRTWRNKRWSASTWCTWSQTGLPVRSAAAWPPPAPAAVRRHRCHHCSVGTFDGGRTSDGHNNSNPCPRRTGCDSTRCASSTCSLGPGAGRIFRCPWQKHDIKGIDTTNSTSQMFLAPTHSTVDRTS